jgi:chromosome segregation ATPase
VDRLVASCVAKDPAVRCQRMQKIIMELKLLSVAARRAETPAPNRGQAEAQFRTEIHQLEARIAARMASHEKATAQMQQAHERALAQMQEEHQRSLTQMQEAASDVNTLRGQLAEVSTRIADAQGRVAQPIAEMRAMVEQILARVEHTVEPIGTRLADMEETLQDVRNRTAAVQADVAADLSGIALSISTHAAAIDSARTAMAQTDDLVERVIGALELLQNSVLDQHEERAAPIG